MKLLKRIKKLKFHAITGKEIRHWAYKEVFRNVHNFIIYWLCLVYFSYYFSELLIKYLRFETNVLIRYETPNVIHFPAFTVCGCSLWYVLCTKPTEDVLNEQLEKLYANVPIIQLLNDGSDGDGDNGNDDADENFYDGDGGGGGNGSKYGSFPETNLVLSCNYIQDSRNPRSIYRCNMIKRTIGSLQNGRKCFTYLTKIFDNSDSMMIEGHGKHHHLHHNRSSQQQATPITTTTAATTTTTTTTTTTATTITDTSTTTPTTIPTTTYTNTSNIAIIINFNEVTNMNFNQMYNSTVIETNVVIALHNTDMIPNALDVAYNRLLSGYSYEYNFGKQITKLMPAPYKTRCKYYDTHRKPRSQNECINLCILRVSYYQNNCIIQHTVVTKIWLTHLHRTIRDFPLQTIKFCTQSNSETYVKFVEYRRQCQEECDERDCEQTQYSASYDLVELNSARSNITTIVINADRKLYELVQHNPELNSFELIGSIGGHAHIWLGFSALQFYDVMVIVVKKFWILLTRLITFD